MKISHKKCIFRDIIHWPAFKPDKYVSDRLGKILRYNYQEEVTMIKMYNVCKSYKVAKRNAGFGEACKSLFHRQYDVIEALKDVTFTIDDGEMVGIHRYLMGREKVLQSKF